MKNLSRTLIVILLFSSIYGFDFEGRVMQQEQGTHIVDAETTDREHQNAKIIEDPDLIYDEHGNLISPYEEAVDGQHNAVHGDGAATEDTTHEGSETSHESESHYHSPSTPEFWYNALLSLVLTITGAFCSGMTVGLCNIDTLQLEVMSMSKDQTEQNIAKRILGVISNHHLFLVTLLVYNAIALESLPLVVHTLMPDWAAIIFSTVVVLVAAEIVPQAICTGPKKITLAYYASPIISFMTKALCFVIYPMARGLDWLLGTHEHHRIQHKDFANFLTGNKILKKTEKNLLTSTLQLRTEKVEEKMIPLKKLYMIEMSEPLTETKVNEIYKKDYSYILVYKDHRQNILGVIKVKEFALKYLKSEKQMIKVGDILDQNTNFLSVYKDTNLLEMLMLFQANSSRIALISDEKKKTDSNIPSIMYTKTDMLMKKKGANIIGAIFLYTIFDQIADFEHNVAQPFKEDLEREMKEMKEMKELDEPLLKH